MPQILITNPNPNILLYRGIDIHKNTFNFAEGHCLCFLVPEFLEQFYPETVIFLFEFLEQFLGFWGAVLRGFDWLQGLLDLA